MIPFVRWDSVPYGVAEPVSPLIRRVTANNPGPFTYTGTQTYLVGGRDLAVIDPGPDMPGQVDAILGSVTYGLVIKQTGNEAQYGRKYKVSDNFQGMAVRKGDQEMLDFLNDFVTRHTADGTLDALYKKWIGVDRAKLPTTLPGVDFTGKQ